MPDWRWVIGALFLLAAIVLAAGWLYEKAAESHEAKRDPPPGRMVAVGIRRLHLFCEGGAGPAVVIEQGAGEAARLWWAVQQRVAEFARVCTYDRAGYGWSDPAPAGRMIEERADELHALLMNAGVPGPYILVAHSYGGLIVRSFAARYPQQTAGLVLVDTPDEATIFRPEVLKFYARIAAMQKAVAIASQFGVMRLLRYWMPLDRFGLLFARAGEYKSAADDLESLSRVAMPMREAEGFGTLGDKPLEVLTHGRAFPGPFAILEKTWSEGQKRLAGLSTNGRLTVAEKSNHMIQIDEPDLVVEAIRRVHAHLC